MTVPTLDEGSISTSGANAQDVPEIHNPPQECCAVVQPRRRRKRVGGQEKGVSGRTETWGRIDGFRASLFIITAASPSHSQSYNNTPHNTLPSDTHCVNIYLVSAMSPSPHPHPPSLIPPPPHCPAPTPVHCPASTPEHEVQLIEAPVWPRGHIPQDRHTHSNELQKGAEGGKEWVGGGGGRKRWQRRWWAEGGGQSRWWVGAE